LRQPALDEANQAGGSHIKHSQQQESHLIWSLEKINSFEKAPHAVQISKIIDPDPHHFDVTPDQTLQ
jgi:hypothetical protein